MPAVSVIITSHNRPHLLPRAIESARAAGKDVEVVVVDDASTDETARVCQGMSAINYVRVERNQQVAGARNIGILRSQGEYVSFLDDDDARLARTLDAQVAALAAAPDAGLIYAQALVADQAGIVEQSCYPQRCPQGDVFWELLEQNFIPCGTVVFRRACLFRVGLLEQTIPGIDDWDLWIRIASLYPVVALAQPSIIWRKSTPVSGQGSSRAAELVRLSARQFRQNWARLPRVASAPASVRRAAWRRFSQNMAGHMAGETLRALGSQQFLQAQRNIRLALWQHPWGLAQWTTCAARRWLRRVREQGGQTLEDRAKQTEQAVSGRCK